MSTNILRMKGREAAEIYVTSFYDVKDYGRSVQITIGTSYIALTQDQAEELRDTLDKWLRGEDLPEVE